MKSLPGTLGAELRYCADIGMWAIDRPIASSCVHKTAFCESTCFNNKFYKLYANDMAGKDVRNEAAWLDNDVQGLADTMSRKKKGSKNRFRLMTRGEAISSFADIDRIVNLAKGMPKMDFWVPTRSWRSPVLFAAAMLAFKPFKNLSIMASMDPSNSDGKSDLNDYMNRPTLSGLIAQAEAWEGDSGEGNDWEHVKLADLNTMFYGDDSMKETPNGDRVFKCPKTWKHANGHCGICKGGCFRKSKRVDVHLKQH